MVPFGSHLEVLVPLGPLGLIATTRPTTRYATMVIPSYEVSAASGALVKSYKQALVKRSANFATPDFIREFPYKWINFKQF